MGAFSAGSWPIDAWLLDTSISDTSVGSLFDPWGNHVIGRAHETIRRIYGSHRSFICPAGTSIANKLGLYTLVTPGDEVLVERDCHVSIVQALDEIGAIPRWLVPPFDPVLGINLATPPERLSEVLDRYPNVRAVVLTSPKYFGVADDIAGCVALCQARDVPIMVDEAHGACLAFHPALPTSAVTAGADIVTQSTHKTTEALSQGSVLHLNNEALERRFLHALHGATGISTSYNQAIVASVEEAIVALANDGPARLAYALRLAADFRQQVARIAGLTTWGVEKAGGAPGFRALDPLRVTVDVSASGFTGIEIDGQLQDQQGATRAVVPELADFQHVLFLITYGNTQDDVDFAITRLAAITATAPAHRVQVSAPPVPGSLPRQWLIPRDAYWAVARGETTSVDVGAAVGQISAECIAVYPPGNAIVVHGEEVTDEAVVYLSSMAAAGAHLKGASDPRFGSIHVLT
jgi:arginine decarboxylase